MPGGPDVITNEQLWRSLQELHQKADIIMSQQDDLNADETSIDQSLANLGTAATDIQAEIAALKAANPALDLSGLDSRVAALATAVAGVSAIAAPPATT